jgi:hypothetical protein
MDGGGLWGAAMSAPEPDSSDLLLNSGYSMEGRPERTASNQPSRWSAIGYLHRDVRLELQRLNGQTSYDFTADDQLVCTPVGEYRIPPAIREFMTVSWPAGYTIRSDFGWRVQFMHAPIEAGLVPETRAWLGIAEDEGQYVWIVDLADKHPENPAVYRVDQEGQENKPYGEKLSSRLAGCILTKEAN